MLAGYIATLSITRGLDIESNILQLLPDTQSDPAINTAFDNFSDVNMRQLVFLLRSESLGQAKQGAVELADSLEQSPWIDQLVAQVPPDRQQEIAEFNYSFRNHLLTNADAERLENGQFSEMTDDTIARIYSPLTGWLVDLLATDPFLLSYRFSSAMAATESQVLTLDDGFLVASVDGNYHVLLTATLRQSPFNRELQEDVLARVDNLEQQWQESDPDLSLIRTGALFYTADGFDTARGEISVFGGASLLLVLLLIVSVFRSMKPILLVSLALAFGIASGFALVQLIFGHIHLLTFIFGASLIGVAVDYAFHYFAVDAKSSDRTRLAAVFPAITLGLISSIVGYTALMATPFPGLQQMAVFCIAGLVGAYATVVLLFPMFQVNTSGSERIVRICQSFIAFGGSKQARLVWLAALGLPMVAAVMVLTKDFHGDNIREFQARNPALESQEAAVQSVLKSPAANQFYLVRGDTPEAVLVELENIQPEMAAMAERGVLDASLSVSPWLQSVQRQQRNNSLLSGLYSSTAPQQLIAAGLLTQAEFDQVLAEFSANQNNYLLPDEWLQSPIGEQLSSMWLGEIEGSYFAVVALRGIRSVSELSDINNNVVFVDQVSTVNELLRSYRETAGLLLLIAAGLILAFLSIRYGLKRAALVLSSPLIAMSMTVVVLALFGQSVNLFNVLALFLVLGIGIDFGIFFAESGKLNPHTQLAILMSALTTTFSFGMLSMSSTSVIQSFGLSMLIGISIVLLLSPTIGNLVTNKEL